MTERAAAERERMYSLMWETNYPGSSWGAVSDPAQRATRRLYDSLLARFPQLWDSLPPDPAEQAKREAREDRAYLGTIQSEYAAWGAGGFGREHYPMWVGDLLAIISRMTARAKAGYDVLPDRGE